MKRFNEWLAIHLGSMLSSMGFFYACVILDLIQLPPVIQSHNVLVWGSYISQTVIQLIALPILGVMQKITQDMHDTSNDHHEAHAEKLDKILEKLN